MQLALQMIAQRLDIAKTEIDREQYLDEGVIDELDRGGFFKKFSKTSP
jgi:hypothetical protein